MSLAWTMSSTSRVLACPASAALAQAHEPAGEAAERGTAIHLFLEHAVNQGRDLALAAIPPGAPHRAFCESIETQPALESLLDLEQTETVKVEWTVAYHPATGGVRDLGTGIGRDYPDAPGWVHGTLDLVVGYLDAAPIVVDWKTSREPEPAATSGQLAIAALTVSLLWGVDRVTVAIGHVREDGRIHLDTHVYTAADLDAVADRMRRAWREAARASIAISSRLVPDTNLGPHCRWCPAAGECPSQVSLARRMLTPIDRPLAAGLEVATAEEVGLLWARLEQVKPRLEEAEAALKRAVERHGEVTLPDGRRVTAQQTSVRSVDGRVALQVLTDRFGSAPQAAPKMTLADIERWSKGANVDPDEAVAAVDAAGGVHQKTITRHVVRKAG